MTVEHVAYLRPVPDAPVPEEIRELDARLELLTVQAHLEEVVTTLFVASFWALCAAALLIQAADLATGELGLVGAGVLAWQGWQAQRWADGGER